MSRRDIFSSVNVMQSLIPGSYNSVRPGFGVDLKGYNAAQAGIVVGVVSGTDPVFAFRVQESDDDGSYSNVAPGDLQGTFKNPVVRESDLVITLGYLGNKRFVRLSIVGVGGTNATMVCAGFFNRGLPALAPVPDRDIAGRF